MISDQDLIKLATEHAYSKKEVGDVITIENNNYVVKECFNEKTGYSYGLDAFLIENELGENAVVFTGSSRKTDFYNDWIDNNLKMAFNIESKQYIEGEKLINNLIAEGYEIEYVCGNSLGGGVSAYVGSKFSDIRSINVNPAPQIFKSDKEYDNIINYIDKNDILYNLSTTFNHGDYIGKTEFFSRGNNFFDFRINHLGFDDNKRMSIGNQFPLDLITNSNYSINIDKIQIDDLNSAYLNKLKGYKYEFDIEVRNKSITIDDTFTSIANIQLHMYEWSKNYYRTNLPSLFNSEYFININLFTTNCLFEILDYLINEVREEIGLSTINNNITLDLNNLVTNYEGIDNYQKSKVNCINVLSKNFESTDNGFFNNKQAKLSKYNIIGIKSNSNYQYLNLVNYAKVIVKKLLSVAVYKYVEKYDVFIKDILFGLNKFIGAICNVMSILDMQTANECVRIETIITEIYSFDIKLYIELYFNEILTKLVNVIIPPYIKDRLNALNYGGGILTNLLIVNRNHSSYISAFKSISLNNILKYNKMYDKKIANYVIDVKNLSNYLY